MTITYTEDLATAQDLSVFWSILYLWKGSLYQIIWPNMVLYVASYFTLSFSYRMVMSDEQRYDFERFVHFCRLYVEKINVPFFLGFFVTQVYNRWWQQFYTLPWPDGTAVALAGHMGDVTSRCRNMRKQIIRYACLSFTFLMRTMCYPIRDRFKRRTKFIDHGLLTEDELYEMRRLRLEDEYRPHWIAVLQWSAITAAQATDEGSLPSEEQLCQFLHTLSGYMDSLLLAWLYNWMNIPMCYTQIVTLVVYIYYFFQLFAQQNLLPRTDCIHQDEDTVPLYLFTQFFFFMGWLKTAEVLINPFGEDDDDLDINWLVDRNFEMTVVADDYVVSRPTVQLADWYWSQTFPDADEDSTLLDQQYMVESRAGSISSRSSVVSQGNAEEHEETDMQPKVEPEAEPEAKPEGAPEPQTEQNAPFRPCVVSRPSVTAHPSVTGRPSVSSRRSTSE